MDSKRKKVGYMFAVLTIGFILGSTQFIFGNNIWDNTTNYVFINASYPQVVNVSLIYEANSRVCTVSNGLCASSGGNSSWNETRANALYYSITNPNSYLNYTYNSTYAGYGTAITNLQTANQTVNASATRSLNLIASLTNISYSNIVTAVGNWSLDKTSYVLVSGISGAVGQNLTYALINSNMGNASKLLGNCGVNTVIQNITATGVQCVTDQTGGGTGGSVNGTPINVTSIYATGEIEAQFGLTQHGRVPVIDTQTAFCDFNVPYITTMCYPNYLITIATGVPLKANSYITSNGRSGVLNITTTAVANTGAVINQDPTTYLLNGSEMFSAGIRFPIQPNNQTLAQIGFIDVANLQTESVDGVYFYSLNRTISARVSNNSVRLYSAINFTSVVGQWYDFRIEIAPNGTQAKFYIYNGSLGASLTPLFQTNITGRLPSVPGRETGAGVSCGATTIGAVTQACQIDYIQTEIERQTRQGLQP